MAKDILKAIVYPPYALSNHVEPCMCSITGARILKQVSAIYPLLDRVEQLLRQALVSGLTDRKDCCASLSSRRLSVGKNPATENPAVLQVVNRGIDLIQRVSMRDEVVQS
jgi:hypothetical protein